MVVVVGACADLDSLGVGARYPVNHFSNSIHRGGIEMTLQQQLDLCKRMDAIAQWYVAEAARLRRVIEEAMPKISREQDVARLDAMSEGSYRG